MSAAESDLVWIELHVEAFGDDYVSISRAEWEAMSEVEQEQWIQEAVNDHLSNDVSAGGSVVDLDEVPGSHR